VIFLDESKRKQGFARLIELSFVKKSLMITSLILSGASAILGFTPHVFIYLIFKDILSSLDGGVLVVSKLITYGWLAFAGAAACTVIYFIALVASHLAAFGTLYKLKINFATHLARVPLGFHVLAGSGKLRKVIDDDIEKIEGFIAHQLPDMIAATVSVVTMIALLFSIDWRFGLPIFIGIIFLVYKLMTLQGNNESSARSMRSYQDAIDEMSNASVEYIRGMSVVKAFKQTANSFGRLSASIEKYKVMILKYTLGWEKGYSALISLFNNIYIFFLPVAIIIGMLTDITPVFISNILFYLLFSQSIAPTIIKMVYANGVTLQITGSVERMDNILAEPELPVPVNAQKITEFDIKFENVTFSYDKSTEINALSNVSFTASPSTTTALVGPSGGGKSSTAHLIPRFFDVRDGSIKIGDVDIRNVDNTDLMNNIGFVFQDVFLFSQSIMENIRMGNPKASDHDIIQAAKSAQCHEFVMALPDKYNTIVGAKGIHFSSGERQRIVIARAIIKDCPIVVLDEATSFADPENEYLIQKAFESLLREKTVIMIAHRLSSVKDADQIIVMREGQVLQKGRHDEMLQQVGAYADMWKIYSSAAKWRLDNSMEEANYD
jgi:ATP-binding cassette subfamily B protein